MSKIWISIFCGSLEGSESNEYLYFLIIFVCVCGGWGDGVVDNT